MKQFVITLFFIGCALAGPPPPECLKGPDGGKCLMDCCKIPDLVPQEIVAKCEAANPRPAGPPPPGPPKGCCMSECIFTETGMMVGGKMDKAIAIKYMSDRMAGDADSIKAVTAAIEFCSKEADSKKAEFDDMMKAPAPPGEKQCNMASGFLIGCVSGQVMKNCPKDKLVADADCGKLSAFVDKCGFLYPSPPKA